MENEEINRKSIAQTKRIYIFLPVILLIIIAILGIYTFMVNSKEFSDDIKRNINSENELREIVNLELQEQKSKGIDISIIDIEVIDFSDRSKATIELKCPENQGKKIELELLNRLSSKIIEKYPEKYGNENIAKNLVNIECKHQ